MAEVVKERKPTYNKTQLMVEQELERHMFHRDRFAHYLRWSYVLRRVKNWSDANILDVGCGDANLLKTLYVNRRSPHLYWGVDIRQTLVDRLKEDWKDHEAVFTAQDIVREDLPQPGNSEWDYITCFEVCEHVGKRNVGQLLDNIKKVMSPKTVLMLSTPAYDPAVGAAGNHIIDGEVAELTLQEMSSLMGQRFKVQRMYGTFSSKKDIYPHLTNDELVLYDRLSEYYDSNVMSVIFAPLYPEWSRNVLWEVTL